MSTDIYPLDIPMYSQATASRLVRLSQGRVRRWLRGYGYDYTPVGEKTPQRRKKPPVVHRGETEGSQYASFLDLIEMFLVKQLIDDPHVHLSIQKIRKALDEVKSRSGGHHHLALRRIWSSGSELYQLLTQEEEDKEMVQLLSGGQRVFTDVIMKAAHHIDLGKTIEFVEKWYPLGNEEPVVIDPRISFGAPTITGRRIETANIYDLYLGEGHNIDRVCFWMDLTEREVRAALAYEESLHKKHQTAA